MKRLTLCLITLLLANLTANAVGISDKEEWPIVDMGGQSIAGVFRSLEEATEVGNSSLKIKNYLTGEEVDILSNNKIIPIELKDGTWAVVVPTTEEARHWWLMIG